jgi:hypothetical protein
MSFKNIKCHGYNWSAAKQPLRQYGKKIIAIPACCAGNSPSSIAQSAEFQLKVVHLPHRHMP